jgi:hypothetical protein
MITDDNRIVHGLWIGNRLSDIEILTLRSFIHQGHEFHLWIYEPISNIPGQVVTRDANQVIPAKDIIVRKYNDPVTGVGKGSVGAPFSDMFRYKLLYEYGGWWVDMDMTCLKPLQIEEPYFFRNHLFLEIIGNVMKCPKGSELMRRTYQEARETCDENTLDWLLPNKILNKHIRELGLIGYKRSDISNRDEWPETKKYIRTRARIPDEWYLIHWMNEEWRVNGIDKAHIRQRFSTLGELMKQNGVETGKKSFRKMLHNELMLVKPFSNAHFPNHLPSTGIMRLFYYLKGVVSTIFYHAVYKHVNTFYWFLHGHVKYYIDKYLVRK